MPNPQDPINQPPVNVPIELGLDNANILDSIEEVANSANKIFDDTFKTESKINSKTIEIIDNKQQQAKLQTTINNLTQELVEKEQQLAESTKKSNKQLEGVIARRQESIKKAEEELAELVKQEEQENKNLNTLKHKLFDDWFKIFLDFEGFELVECFDMEIKKTNYGMNGNYKVEDFKGFKEPIMSFKKVR